MLDKLSHGAYLTRMAIIPTSLTEIQFALLTRLHVGDRIRRRFHARVGFYFTATSPAGAEIEVERGLGGRRQLTASTLNGLVKKGYLSYDDSFLGSWTRTAKEMP